MRKHIPKYNYNKVVHWEFECGCKYLGYYYLYNKYRRCLKHNSDLETEHIRCKCGNVFTEKAKGRSRTFCGKCVEEKKEKYLKEVRPEIRKQKVYKKKKCRFPKCNGFVMAGNYFLCSIHYYNANMIIGMEENY